MADTTLFILGAIAILSVIIIGALATGIQLSMLSPAGEFSAAYGPDQVIAGTGESKCSISCEGCGEVSMCSKTCPTSNCRATCTRITCDDGSTAYEAKCICSWQESW